MTASASIMSPVRCHPAIEFSPGTNNNGNVLPGPGIGSSHSHIPTPNQQAPVVLPGPFHLVSSPSITVPSLSDEFPSRRPCSTPLHSHRIPSRVWQAAIIVQVINAARLIAK
ncbi:hypothetical protein CERZMDRAFT_80634 [Cercospora zeae-maydis SCOH1-5]|uniref:Uncharacterized protein n=1 Tax=Cercospora zeae-maydis SCOH1-5 TaxID=717836 RepID=A0A6A6FWZ5_9PEZI|nr:hypothetical protein CERZMDRAFT_80634 [Cercospora zeae-maydis SCOH1-5]